MTDDTQHVAIADFSLLVRRAEKAASDALTAVEAMERLFAAFAPRLNAIEGRFDSLERRQSVLEASLARSYMLIHGPVFPRR